MTAVHLDTPTLTTPSGVLLYDGPARTPEWFAARRRGVTATDVASIVVPGDHGNALSVWLDKTGDPLPDDAGEAAYWGTVLEEPIAARWAALHGVVVEPIGILANVAAPWMLASLDRVTRGCPEGRGGACPLEVKSRSAFVAGGWREDVPDDVLAQVTWQMVVSGFDHVHVAVLFGGQRLQSFTIERDDALAEFLVEEAERVWGNVQANVMPDVDSDAFTVRCLNHMWPDRDGAVELAADEARALIDAYEDARLAVAAAEEAKAKARARIVAALGSSVALFAEGKPAATFKADARGVRTLRIAKRYQKEAAA